jgi:hypothetical protein
MGNYQQPGAPGPLQNASGFGGYDPGAIKIACPICGTIAMQCGSGRFPWRCQQGHQTDISIGTVLFSPGVVIGGGMAQISDALAGYD